MCGAGLAGTVLRVCGAALRSERHPLHSPAMYMLERLAAHALRPIELREFLRMGNPLNCIAPEAGQVCKPGGPVPLTRIKTLVSMTTPKDYRSQNSCTLPPFVEFDMSAEGFGCLYLPSIAPQSANLNALGTQDNATLGGIGSGDRVFPPQTGLTYSTWICVEKYSDPRTDPHCVRLLTLVRNLNNSRDEHLVCLTVVLSARDKAIIVSTQETLVPHNVGEWEPEGSGECGARVWCPDLQHEGQWHHLALVLNRAVLKNSSFSLYLDGQHMHSGKLHYVSANPGGGAATLSGASSVYCVIGTPPQWRRYSRLVWRQGPATLLEEVLPAQTVSIIYQLGPHYVGTLQAPLPPGQNQEPLTPLVAEEKVVFGINARAMSQLTLAKIRKVYSKNDNKAIAKQLGMSSHENATPIRILHNSAGHLMGPARCLGGTVVGYLGVRVFCPKPAAIMIDTVGGCSVLLGLIAMAQDVECLYAGVKALVCVVRSNKAAQAEMDRRKGYQTLAMLLKRKKQLLNSHILHLIFGLVGTVDSQKETSSIPNLTAFQKAVLDWQSLFQDLICELEVWLGAPGGLIKSLLEHLLELATETAHRTHNLRTMRELQLVSKLLYIINDVKIVSTKNVLIQLLSALLGGQPRPSDLLCLGQFMAYTLPLPSQTEKGVNLKESDNEKECEGEQIILRNKCFNVLHGLLFTQRNLVNTIVCEEISRVLGLDWLLSFMQENVHPTTVLWALRILVILCSGQGQQSAIMQRFREGAGNGGWLRHTEVIAATQQAGVVLTTAVQSHSHLHTALLHTSGFNLLAWLVLSHLQIPELYYLLFGLTLGQPMRNVGSDRTVSVERVWASAWGAAAPSRQSSAAVAARITLCPEAVVILLGAVRALIHAEPGTLPEWLNDHPVAIIQVLFSLYNTLPDFVTIMMTAEVLNALAATLFPPNTSDDIHMPIGESGESSGASTPGSEKEVVLVGTTAALTQHPARQHVMDFLRVIVLDSLPLNVTGKTAPVIDLVLDASPPNSNNQQQIEYQTEVLTTLMENLLNTELFGTESNISNVCYLAARLVDKLWQGQLSRDPHEVFDFIVKLVTQAKKKSSVISLEGLHHCLNRTILFLLSRSTESIADQMSVLEALHKLTTNRLLIFGAGNHELEFIGCLTYCLLQLSANMKIALDSHMRTTWHVNPSGDLESRDDKLTTHQGRNLMAGAARRVWEELYACKKPAIEEVFKMTLILPVGNSRAPDLSAVREQLNESAHKLWINYIDSERKAVYRVPWELHNQIQSKIQKVTGGLTRLASRTKVKKEDTAKQRPHVPRDHALAYMQDHVQLVRQAWCVQLQTASNTSLHTTRYVQAEWTGAWRELTRERGLWGPPKPSHLDKWALDSTEGPCRMRKMLKRNHRFYMHYPYRPELEIPENKQLKYKVAQSFDSKEYYRVYQQWRTPGNNLGEADGVDSSEVEAIQQQQQVTNNNNRDSSLEVTAEDGSPSDLVSSGVVSRGKKDSSGEANEDGPENEDEDEPQPAPDNQTLLRLLEHHEKITHMFRCARIQGLDTEEGLLLFGREHCYVIDGFTLLKNREIRDLDSCPDDYEPILPSQAVQRSNQRLCSKFLYEDIREVHKRRYLLQPIALEVFSSDGRNYLLAFPRKVRNKVYSRFTALATGMADSAQGSVAGQKRGVAVEQPAGLLASLIGDTSVTQRWLRGEISNFQYLMHLNTLAGRSYNDLMQYPVFPWILADYDSLELDLTDPATFRDLTKPMGAQSPDRLEQFRKRYKEWDDPHGETPPYHYGTHYSSAMIVCSYLVRMEPFTQHFLRLQGGHFDLADRMFHSIKEGWNSASKHNMADVKELIPEFFYLPEFLVNSNNFDLGFKQSGVALGDIVLPPWAKGDPREFIRLHRAALESDYVSHRLHHWIDLVFGYKQQGQPAVEACNVFHHLFYEGNVDIYNIDDPLKKNATIGFINNFGQIPKQLFKKAHPSKKMSQRSSTILDPNNIMPSQGITPPEKLFFHNLENLRPSLQPVKEVKGPVGQILYTDKAILAVEQNKVLMPPAYNKYVAWGFADHSLRIGNYDNDKAVFVCEAVAQACGEIVTCVCPSAKTIVTAGTSSVVTVWQYSARRRKLSVKVCLYGHEEAITCLAASTAYNLVVSGSRDGQTIVWDVERGSFVRQLLPTIPSPPPVSALAIDELTGDIATCVGSYLYAWSINGTLLGSVDTCGGGARQTSAQQVLCCAFSQTREWDPLNVILTGSTDGVVRVCSHWCRHTSAQQVLCCAFSQTREWDPLNVILTGSTDGVVRVCSHWCRQTSAQQVLCCAFSQTREWDPLNVILTGSTDGVVRVCSHWCRQTSAQQVLCCAFSQTREWDPLNVILTGSTDGVVRVCSHWCRQTSAQQVLCCAFSQTREWDPLNVILTGSTDGVVRVCSHWCRHTSAQQVLCCAFSQTREWDPLNVILTGSTDGVVRVCSHWCRQTSAQQVLCCAFSQTREWDPLNVILTGSTDGVVRVCSHWCRQTSAQQVLCCAFSQTREWDPLNVILTGSTDGVVRVCSHWCRQTSAQQVLCCAFSQTREWDPLNVILTGSTDGVVRVCSHWCRQTSAQQVLCCAFSQTREWDPLNVILTGSTDGVVRVCSHWCRQTSAQQVLCCAFSQTREWDPLNVILTGSTDGVVRVCSHWCRQTSAQQVLCCAFSQTREWDPLNVILTGSTDGVVRVCSHWCRQTSAQQVLCCAFSQTREWDPLNVILTGSTDGVVRVCSHWCRQTSAQQVLCCAFSQTREWDPLNVILTGSTDGVVRVCSHWCRQTSAQQVLCCAFSQTREWDPLNVILTGSTDGVVRVCSHWCRQTSAQQVLCCAFSQTREWDPLNVILTGSTDGVVRMWSIDYVAEETETELTENQDDEPQSIDAQTTEPTSLDPISSSLDVEQENSKLTIQDSEEAKSDVEGKSEGEGKEEIEEGKREAAIKRVEALVKQMSLSQEQEGTGNLTKSASESSLSEAETTSAKESARRHDEKDVCSDNDDLKFIDRKHEVVDPYTEQKEEVVDSCDEPKQEYDNEKDVEDEKEQKHKLEKQGNVVLRRKSKGNPLYRKSGGSIGDSSESGSMDAAAQSADGAGEGGLRASKSDTSLTDSFVVVSAPASPATKHKQIKPPLSEIEPTTKWVRRVVLRGKLTMHTAYERRDNACPASVTAVAAARSGRGLAVGDARGRVSVHDTSKLTMHTAYERRDNACPASVTAVAAARSGRGLAVGDARGRIFRWSAPDMTSSSGAKGGPADHWIRDDTAPFCTQCQVRFTALERRHHCRECGCVFCGRCSRYEAPVRRLRALRPVRVCQTCYTTIHNKH
ncbi:hypothetical protein O0L34_g11414 [Tuta absoluta]|nr:hypothetical protein O0L34_g11414 [Tuta absoluta]